MSEQPLPEYNPRLTDSGMRGNPYWYSRNPFYNAGYGLPNCTCYAWGRFWEIGDPNRIYENRPNLSTGNAEDWFGHTSDGYDRGSEPALGAIACYSGGIYSGLGHVCVVEEIDEANNRCLVSESGYGAWYFRASHYISMNGNYNEGGYTFQGFIYNPFSGGGPSEWNRKIWMFKRLLWKREQELIR